MKPKKIALIGGAGFIGHNLAIHLKGQGHEVELLDSLGVNHLLSFSDSRSQATNQPLYWRMLTSRLELLKQKGIPLHVIDARDYHALSHKLGAIQPQVVVMLAAVAHADRSNKDPYSTFDHSFRTLENALDYSKNNVEHFIYFSSSMVYGNFAADSVDEETTCNPLGIYGALKFSGEKIVIAYNQVFDLPYTIVRPSALYGERCVSRRVCQIFIENAMQGTKITIAGDGSDRLDFTYIQDLVDGVGRIIECPAAKNETFNLTFGRGRSVAELAEIIKSEFRNIDIEFKSRDKLMPERGTLSVEKAKSVLGYVPSFPIEKGIPRYVDWYRSFWPRAVEEKN